ncbi:MAG: hypothetical protein IIA11_05895 [Proteobacteria bacterium]|nr:hypothetical protein [Pseudomonadota bacterium]
MHFKKTPMLLIMASVLTLATSAAYSDDETTHTQGHVAGEHRDARDGAQRHRPRMTDEERQARRDRRESMTDEEREAARERFENMSDEDRRAMRRRNSNMSDEERQAARERYKNMSDEERRAMRKQMRDRRGSHGRKGGHHPDGARPSNTES